MPDLDAPKPQVAPTPQPTVTQPVTTSVPTPQPAAAPKVEQPTATPVPTPQPISAPVSSVEVKPEEKPIKEASTEQPSVEEKAPEQPKEKTEVVGSLTAMLKEVSASGDGEVKKARIVIDPDSESKMMQAKDQIVWRMCSERPRYVSAFESIEFEGNMVKLAVPSEALREELIGERSDILRTIANIAGVNGSLDMYIEIKEMHFKLKPIKLEDRVAHMRNAISEFDYMQKKLDMDVE